MRENLASAFVVTLATVGLLALGPVPVVAQSGRLVIGVAAGPETLDPHMSASLPTWNVARNVFESLLARDLKTFGYKPGLAESHRIIAFAGPERAHRPGRGRGAVHGPDRHQEADAHAA
jgi:ABC-type oligopeptide transport system substrate-binding subunit